MYLCAMIIYAMLLLAAYLLGSVPSAVWVGRRFYGIDVREHGSRNAGATNTLRVLGRQAAAAVFAMDVLKGFIAVKLALIVPESGFYFILALVLAVIAGHIFPIFAGFRGGKGVATMCGAILAINFPAVAMCLGVFVAVLYFSNYVSLSSMTAGMMFPLLSWVTHRSMQEMVFACVVAVLLVFTHRRNIRRLITGSESKIYLVKRK
jgi:glycerol-3-phosphate acyltransferase PlsY